MPINAVRIHPADDVVVLLHPVAEGERIAFGADAAVVAAGPIAAGHKAAIRDLDAGVPLNKYGFPIGLTTCAIRAGEWVHSHNLSTGLDEQDTYEYHRADHVLTFREMGSFDGYRRADGSVGVRNEIWILPMVSCVNHTARLIAEQCRQLEGNIDGVFALENPFGCSQLGEDHETTVTILRNIASHPNAAGVLLLSLGCENNTMPEFLAGLSEEVRQHLRILVAQDHADEIAAGVAEIRALIHGAAADRRTPQPLSSLRVGFKCGASDGFSGLTANPLAGRVCERLVAHGASTVLTEVSEMFGAETILMERARDEQTFQAIVDMIQGFKQYYVDNGQPVYENPSPGNREGGITTVEEKSIGCIQKGGHARIEDVLPYGGRVRVPGLTLLTGPGNDPVSITAMAAAGCQMIIFTTGRGNPLGSFVPTVKVGSNARLAALKQGWIDFSAAPLLEGADMDALADQLYALVLDVANGRRTRSETAGYKEIGIFKSGVIL